MQRENGLYKILNLSLVYNLVQQMVGGPRSRKMIADQFCQVADGDRVLDVACGTGAMIPYLNQNIEYVGMDFNQSHIQQAQINYNKKGISFFAADATEPFPVSENYFDLVLSIGMLHHISDENVDKVLKNIYQALKSGGKFVAMEAIHYQGQSRLARLITSRDQGACIRTTDQYQKICSNFFSPNKINFTLWEKLRIPYTNTIIECYK